MSKELTPLEALNNIKNLFIGSPIKPTQQFEIIETALKRLEKYDNDLDIEPLKKAVLKQDEILRIIKEKGLHYLEIALIQGNCSYEDYLMECNRTIDIGLIRKSLFDCKPKTQAEFDLLKEWLK